VAVALLVAAWPAAAQENGFPPHELHIEVVPICTDCHEGIPRGDRATFYPSLEWCQRCHTVDEVPEDTWSERAPRAGNLRFEHSVHEELVSGDTDAPTCDDCHVPADGPEMAVSEHVQASTCWTCHGDAGVDHLGNADCVTCHVPLSEATLTPEQIEGIPVPADHASDAFPTDHTAEARAQATRCTTCHTRGECVSCHAENR
jgi:hypothetical protein